MPANILRCFTLSLLLLFACMQVIAAELRLGYTGPLQGTNSFVGKQVLRGLQLGLRRINTQQWLNYPLILIPLDDGYEPEKTVEQVTRLIKEFHVKAILSSIGTPTNLASLGVLSKYQIPLISPFSGAQSLRTERETPFIFNTRLSYQEEANLIVKTLLKDLGIKPNEIAIFAQKDSYGDAGLASVLNALKDSGLEDPSSILQIRHQRNSEDVSHSIADVLGVFPIPKVIITISTFVTTSLFIRQLETFGIKPLFATFSIAIPEGRKSQLENSQTQILVSQITPSLSDTSNPLIQQLLEDMASIGDIDPPTNMQLEGYINALVMGRALLPQKTPPTSQEIKNRLIELAKNNKNTQAQNELFVFNHNNIWLQLIEDGVIHDNPDINELKMSLRQ